jgi:hypothetical protein
MMAGLSPLLALPVAASPAQAKNIVITGCNSGIGFDAASKLVARGHKVCRASSPSKAPTFRYDPTSTLD